MRNAVRTKEKDLRAAIVAQCRAMSAAGLSPGTAGNISARFGEAMLITPSVGSLRLAAAGDDGADAAQRRIRRVVGAAEAVDRMALPSRHHAGAARRRRDRSLPPALLHRAGDAQPADPRRPLHDRAVRRPGDRMHALCAVRHQGTVRTRRRGPRRAQRGAARQPRRDRRRPRPRRRDASRAANSRRWRTSITSRSASASRRSSPTRRSAVSSSDSRATASAPKRAGRSRRRRNAPAAARPRRRRPSAAARRKPPARSRAARGGGSRRVAAAVADRGMSSEALTRPPRSATAATSVDRPSAGSFGHARPRPPRHQQLRRDRDSRPVVAAVADRGTSSEALTRPPRSATAATSVDRPSAGSFGHARPAPARHQQLRRDGDGRRVVAAVGDRGASSEALTRPPRSPTAATVWIGRRPDHSDTPDLAPAPSATAPRRRRPTRCSRGR